MDTRQSASSHQVRPDSAAFAAKPVKVLIVDDDPQVLNLLCSYLDHPLSEFSVITASAAEPALELILLENPDLMLTDIYLPDLNGVELIRQALVLDPKLRIVGMTGAGSPELRSVTLREGAVRYVEKPFDLPALYNVLEEIAQGPPWDPAEGICGDAMDALDLTQLMILSRQSGAIQFLHGSSTGLLVYEQGQLIHASCDGLGGEPAFYRLAQRQEGLFHAQPHSDLAGFERNIQTDTERLLFEAARLRDEGSESKPPKEVEPMSKLKEMMSEVLTIQGARVAVIVGWDGFVIEGVAKDGSFGLDALGAVISTSMGSTQVIGRELQVGNVGLAMLEFEKGTVLVRVLGKAGLLAVLVDPDTSLGLPRHQIRKWAPAMEAELA